MIADVAEQRVELERLARVEAGRRLVEAEQDGLRAHRTGDLQTPLRTVGQVAGRIVGARHQVDPLQPSLGGLDRVAFRRAVAADAEKPEHGHTGGAHQGRVLGDEQVFEHRHAREQADILEGSGDARATIDVMVGQPLQQVGRAVPMAAGQHALGRLVEARETIEDGRLAGAVRADQRGDVAAPDPEREIVHGEQSAEAHAQVVDVEHRVLAHQP